jgi:outer membrane protein OmpA-like peptidoglycan-associated protein
MGRIRYVEVVPVRLFTKPVLAVLACLIVAPLGACDTAEGWNTKAHRGGVPDQYDVVDSAPMPVTSRLEDAPGVRAVPDFPPPGDRDLKVMTSKLSGGSVEIYDLDGSTNMSAPVAPVTPDYAGIPMATDSRVTVYPIDGYAAYPGEMPSMQPATQKEWPNSILPMGQTYGSGMTPPPDSFGGDRRMAIENGKLVSKAGTAVSNIYFPYGSARLDRNDHGVLRNVAETAKFAPVDRVSVEGHASSPTQVNDPVKSKILNLKESMKRAAAVSEELIQKGVPAEKIKTVGWGDTKASSGGEAEQRRVDVYTGLGY